MKYKIIDYIKKNRVSTTEIADCLGKQGALPDIAAINQGHFVVGVIKWVYAFDESNWTVHEQVIDTQDGEVVFIEGYQCGDRAIMGELVSKYILLYRQASGIVVDAPMRDARALLKENYPIWCKGFNPIGCYNKKSDKELPVDWINEHRDRYDGAIAVCDECGVVVIPKELHTDEFMNKLEFIENQEDIWFDRLDHYKENTFQIVCEKIYEKSKNKKEENNG